MFSALIRFAAVVPFLTGFLVLDSPAQEILFVAALQRLLMFTLLVVSVSILIGAILVISKGRKIELSRLQSVLLFSRLGLSCVVSLACLQSLQSSTRIELFYLCLATLGALTFRTRFSISERPILELIFTFIQWTLVGFLSVQLLGARWAYEVWLCGSVFASSIAAPVTAMRAAELISRDGSAPPLSLRRAFAILIGLGPALLAGLVFFGCFTPIFLAPLIVLPLAAELISELNLKDVTCELPDRFLGQSTSLCILFVVMLVGASLF